MANEFDRYYIKIWTILGIYAKTIHEELTTALGPGAPSYRTVARWAQRFREGREESMMILDLVVRFPNSQMKILNWFDKLSTMIHTQLMIKL
jgi:hypothetical protein